MVRIEFSCREIVEEKQWLSTLYDQIVDAHRDKIDADSVVDAGFNGDLELGADAVISCDENRIIESGCLEVEQSAEASDFPICARTARGADQRFYLLHHGVADVDIHAGIRIGEAVFPLAHIAPLPARTFKRLIA